MTSHQECTQTFTRSPHPHCTLVRYNIISPMTHKSAEGAAPCSHPGDFDQYAYSQTYSHGSPFTHHTMPGCCASSAREESKWHEARTGVDVNPSATAAPLLSHGASTHGTCQHRQG